MYITALFLFVTILGAACGTPINHEVDLKVVGGRPAKDGEVPYQVALKVRVPNYHFCGGSIISSRTILTSAQCLSGKSAVDIVAVVGTNKLDEGGDVYQAVRLRIHPLFSNKRILYDVGLVIVDRDIEFSEKVQSLEVGEEYVNGSTKVVLSGWGITTTEGSKPNDLQILDLVVRSHDECRAMLWNMIPIEESQLCTFTKSGEGKCEDDSGSPIAVDGKVVGIVSWGTVPCAKEYPDIYTRVSAFASWINDNKD